MTIQLVFDAKTEPFSVHLKGTPLSSTSSLTNNDEDTTAEKRLVLKLDLIFLPWACLSQMMKKIDQNNYKAAYTAGMKNDLSLGGTNALNLLDIYFTIPFVIFLIPSMLLVTRIRPSYFLPTAELVWGTLTACMALCTTVEQMYPIRFFIGAMETSCWCLITTLLLSWYTPKEMAKRQAIFLCSSQAGGMFTFAMQSAIHQTLDGNLGMKGWRWLFVINGIMTVFVAAAGFFAIPDYPRASKAFYFSTGEKDLAYRRLLRYGKRTLESLEEYPGWSGVSTLLKKVVKVALSCKFILVFLCYGLWAWASFITGYFNLYLDSLTNADGSKMYSVKQVTEIPIAANGIAIVSALTMGYISDRFQIRWQMSVILNLILMYSGIVLSTWPDVIGLVYSAFLIASISFSNEPIFMSWIGEICKDDPVERSLVIALALSLTMAGNLALPLFLWPAKEAPHYRYGYKFASAFCGVSIIATVVYSYCQRRQARQVQQAKDQEV